MLHRSGPFNEEKLIDALKGHLPYVGQDLESFDVRYMDDELQEIMVANFIWINNQWIYVDSRKVN
jgi:hypothetical protein